MFSQYILAGYPLLWVETFEEYRSLVQFSWELQENSKQSYDLYSWDRVDGIKKLKNENGILTSSKISTEDDMPMDDPMAALLYAETQLKENAVVFLKDFHHYVKKNDDAIVRKIRNLIPAFKASGRTLVIVSPIVEIPPEIEKEITLIRFKLPTRKELKIVLKAVCESAEIKYPKNDEQILSSALGMTAFEAENAFSVSLIEKKCFDAGIIQREKAAIVKKTQMLEVMEVPVTIDDVGGLENLKQWLVDRVECFSEDAKEFGVTPPKGMLLVGVPGCGKSLVAKASGAILQRPALRLDLGSVYGSYVGDSEANIRRVLNIAEAVAPCVLFIDELEKAFPNLKGDAHETSKRVFGTFLTWMQDKTSDVFIVATANNVQGIPPEMIRRFDKMFWVDLPDAVQRTEILRIHLSHAERNLDDIIEGDPLAKEELAETSKDFSGHEIENWVKESLVRAYSSPDKKVTKSILLDVARDISPVSRLMSDDIKSSRDWAKARGVKNASVSHEINISTKTNGRKIAMN